MTVGGPRWRAPIAPHARGHVPPRVIVFLRADGWTIHQVGRAAYVHRDDLHLIFGVWPTRETPPPWADRLGHPSEGYYRRIERADREQRWRRLARDAAGQWIGLMQWWRWPWPRAYRWDP